MLFALSRGLLGHLSPLILPWLLYSRARLLSYPPYPPTQKWNIHLSTFVERSMCKLTWIRNRKDLTPLFLLMRLLSQRLAPTWGWAPRPGSTSAFSIFRIACMIVEFVCQDLFRDPDLLRLDSGLWLGDLERLLLDLEWLLLDLERLLLDLDEGLLPKNVYNSKHENKTGYYVTHFFHSLLDDKNFETCRVYHILQSLHQKTDFIIIISPPWYDPGCCWGVKPQQARIQDFLQGGVNDGRQRGV